MIKSTKLFLSHPTRDKQDVAPAAKRTGIAVWIAPDSIPPGES